MPIDVKSIKALLGDRILVRPLKAPERRGTLFLPATKVQGKQTEIWFGEIEALGRDARYPDAYGLKVGDVVGIEALGRQCETLAGEDGEEHCWVAEEFFACKDQGRQTAWATGTPWVSESAGLEPVGSYVLVRPDTEEEKRGGIHIPHSSRELQKMGTVVNVSIGEIRAGQLDGLHVHTDATVLFGRFSGSTVKVDCDFILMKQEDVIAVMERTAVVA